MLLCWFNSCIKATGQSIVLINAHGSKAMQLSGDYDNCIVICYSCCSRTTMDMEILLTILLCVIAAMCTLLSLFYFAKRKQKSYEQVNMLLVLLTTYFG